jgi:hypothetical protein
MCRGARIQCDDGNPCTKDACHPIGGCQSSNAPKGTWCDDGDACTLFDNCCDGLCEGLPLVDCDDGNACSDDACDPMLGCTYAMTDDAVPCDDDSACTEPGACAGGVCVGDEIDCSDDNPCTADYCHPTKGCQHAPAPDGWACTDGNACTEGDACQAGSCAPGAPLDCEDGQPCTIDTCDPECGCKATPNVQPEVCDGWDNDCDGQVDEGCTVIAGSVCFDLDGDGVQDDGEQALAGELILLSGACGPDAFAFEVETDASGHYAFALDSIGCALESATVEVASAMPFQATSPNPVDAVVTEGETSAVDFCITRELIHCASEDWLDHACALAGALPLTVAGESFASEADVTAALAAGPFDPVTDQLTAAVLTVKLNVAIHGVGPLPWADVNGDGDADTIGEIAALAETALEQGGPSMWSFVVLLSGMESVANCELDDVCGP